MPRCLIRSRARFSLVLLAVITSLILLPAGCGQDEETTDQQGGLPQPPPGQPGGGHGGSGQQQAIPVAVAAAEAGAIASYYRATATLEPDKEAEVLARVTGVVARLLVEEGDEIEAGAALLKIDNAEYLYRLNQAEAATANLQARYDRMEQMVAEELASTEEFQTVHSDLLSAQADEGLARLNLSYTTVTAPFAGRVTQRLVDPGNNVQNSTPLFVMADFNPLLARVHVPSREFNKLQQDQLVDLVLDSSGARMQGRIKLISPVIDPASGTIKITVEIVNYPAGTRPGDFAQVQIVTERHDGAILVPRIAVLTDKGESVVYTLAADKGDGEGPPRAERRIVEVGFTDDRNAEILAGLDVGETVVVKGQRSLKHGSPLRILEDSTGASR